MTKEIENKSTEVQVPKRSVGRPKKVVTEVEETILQKKPIKRTSAKKVLVADAVEESIEVKEKKEVQKREPSSVGPKRVVKKVNKSDDKAIEVVAKADVQAVVKENKGKKKSIKSTKKREKIKAVPEASLLAKAKKKVKQKSLKKLKTLLEVIHKKLDKLSK